MAGFSVQGLAVTKTAVGTMVSTPAAGTPANKNYLGLFRVWANNTNEAISVAVEIITASGVVYGNDAIPGVATVQSQLIFEGKFSSTVASELLDNTDYLNLLMKGGDLDFANARLNIEVAGITDVATTTICVDIQDNGDACEAGTNVALKETIPLNKNGSILYSIPFTAIA
jgi:hypothetical protein